MDWTKSSKAVIFSSRMSVPTCSRKYSVRPQEDTQNQPGDELQASHLVVFHHAADLELLDAVAHWDQLGCTDHTMGWLLPVNKTV